MARATSAQTPGGIRSIVSDRRVRVVLGTILVTMMGFGIVNPILPLYAQSFGVSYDAVGILVASFAFTRLAFDLVAGPWVDRYGERAMLTIGMVFLAGTTVLLARAPTFAWAGTKRLTPNGRDDASHTSAMAAASWGAVR